MHSTRHKQQTNRKHQHIWGKPPHGAVGVALPHDNPPPKAPGNMVSVKVGGSRGKIQKEIAARNAKMRLQHELRYTREIFKKFDSDNSGSISGVEFQDLCKALGYVFATEAEVDKAVRMIDEDGSGDINWPEFAAWWQSDDKFSDFQHLLDDKAFYHDKSFAQGHESPDSSKVVEVGVWPPCLLHPFGLFRTVWDTVTAAAIVYSALLVPFRMAFETEIETYDSDWWIDKIVDLIFITDMGFAFFTAYYDAETEMMVTDKGEIALKYLKTWFVPDFMASMPFDTLAAAFIFDDDEAGGEQSEQLRLLKMIRMLRLLKIMRMVKMSRLLTKFQETYQIKSGIMISIKFTLICFVCAHYLASGWYVVSRLEPQPWELCKLDSKWDTALMLPELIVCDTAGCPSIDGCMSLPSVGSDVNGTLTIVDDSTDLNVFTPIGWVLHQPFSNWVYRYFIGIQGGSEWISSPNAHCLDCDLHEKFYWGRDDTHKWCTRTGPDGCELVPGAGKKTWPGECNTDPTLAQCRCTGPCTPKYPLGHVPKAKIYAAAVYWSITTMTTLGYGEINGSDTNERYYVLMAIAIGCVVFAYGITNMCTLVANLDAQSLFAQSRSDEIIEWMTKKHVPPSVKKRVLQYFTYKTSYSSVFYYGGEDLLDELSNKLLMNVRQQTLLPVLWTSFLFARKEKVIDASGAGYKQADEYVLFGNSEQERAQADRLMLLLASRLQGQVYAPSEYIAEAGTSGLGLYMMVGGSASLFDKERSAEPLEQCVKGFTYGEHALQYKKVRLLEWLQATSYVDLYFLSREDFHECCKKVRFKAKDWNGWAALQYQGIEYIPETLKRTRTYEMGEEPLQVSGVPATELKLRVLRQQCVEQEDMIGQLVMNMDPLNNLVARNANAGVITPRVASDDRE